MYYIKDANSNQIIYHPGNKTSTGYNIKLTETLNDSGQLTFTLPPVNDMYDDIIEGKLKLMFIMMMMKSFGVVLLKVQGLTLEMKRLLLVLAN